MPTGDARIFRPDGSLAVAKPTDDFDGFADREIDLNENHVMKAHADLAGHYTRPDLIRLLIDTSRKELLTEVDGEGIKTYSTAQRLGLDRPLDSNLDSNKPKEGIVGSSSSRGNRESRRRQ